MILRQFVSFEWVHAFLTWTPGILFFHAGLTLLLFFIPHNSFFTRYDIISSEFSAFPSSLRSILPNPPEMTTALYDAIPRTGLFSFPFHESEEAEMRALMILVG